MKPEYKEILEILNRLYKEVGVNNTPAVFKAIMEIEKIVERKPMKCHCHTCRPIDPRDPESVYMRLCSCGNKRCPKATDHRNECTNSNEPNQSGSIY